MLIYGKTSDISASSNPNQRAIVAAYISTETVGTKRPRVLQRSALGFAAVQFGFSGDKPVPADFDGDGRADLAVFRSGFWHILANFQNYSVAHFGIASDIPVAADYDGDGKTDPAVYRGGIWYVLQSSNAQPFAYQFGLADDRPVPAAFAP